MIFGMVCKDPKLKFNKNDLHIVRKSNDIVLRPRRKYNNEYAYCCLLAVCSYLIV